MVVTRSLTTCWGRSWRPKLGSNAHAQPCIACIYFKIVYLDCSYECGSSSDHTAL